MHFIVTGFGKAVSMKWNHLIPLCVLTLSILLDAEEIKIGLLQIIIYKPDCDFFHERMYNNIDVNSRNRKISMYKICLYLGSQTFSPLSPISDAGKMNRGLCSPEIIVS